MRQEKLTSGFELDLGRYELRCNARRVLLPRKPMELLIFLVSRRDQLVTREEIVRHLWTSDLFVDTESAVNNLIRKIRVVLRDDSEKPRFLETVIGKGYRFVGPVRVMSARPPADERANLPPRSERSQNTSLAVLPLAVAGHSSDDGGLGLGFADALIARLGNLPHTDVLPTSAILHDTPGEDAPDAARRLKVRFVLRGGLQSSKGQWRLAIEVFDAERKRLCLELKCDADLNRLSEIHDDVARRVAVALNRQFDENAAQLAPRHTEDAVAYAEFMRGYRLSSGGDAAQLQTAARHLANSLARDPGFALAHATLSVVCATLHFEFDPARSWLDKAEDHCRRALELDRNLAEAHVAEAFLLWGPSRNFQHLEAIQALRRALSLQKNLPHAYNRLGTILAHIGLLDAAREMYERGRAYHPRRAVSHSIVQVHAWKGEYDLVREHLRQWRAESPGNKYPLYFGPKAAMMKGKWKEAEGLLRDALAILPGEPMIVSLQGLFFALTGKKQHALRSVARACANPKTFGHAHHTYYQIACIYSVLKKPRAAFEWLERSVATGFACWPLFVKDPCLENVRQLSQFDALVASLQAKYPPSLADLQAG